MFTNKTLACLGYLIAMTINGSIGLVCRGCGEKYIGQTGDVIRNRVRVQKQQILHENKRMLGMSEQLHILNVLWR